MKGARRPDYETQEQPASKGISQLGFLVYEKMSPRRRVKRIPVSLQRKTFLATVRAIKGYEARDVLRARHPTINSRRLDPFYSLYYPRENVATARYAASSDAGIFKNASGASQSPYG